LLQIESSNSPANHLVDSFLACQTTNRRVNNLAVPHIDIALLISLPNDDGGADPCQNRDLNNVLQLKLLDFPGKTHGLLLSHLPQEIRLLTLKANRTTSSPAASAFWRCSPWHWHRISDLIFLPPSLSFDASPASVQAEVPDSSLALLRDASADPVQPDPAWPPSASNWQAAG
jgi:hypothetical protein